MESDKGRRNLQFTTPKKCAEIFAVKFKFRCFLAAVISRLGMPTLTFLGYFYHTASAACEALRKKIHKGV